MTPNLGAFSAAISGSDFPRFKHSLGSYDKASGFVITDAISAMDPVQIQLIGFSAEKNTGSQCSPQGFLPPQWPKPICGILRHHVENSCDLLFVPPQGFGLVTVTSGGSLRHPEIAGFLQAISDVIESFEPFFERLAHGGFPSFRFWGKKGGSLPHGSSAAEGVVLPGKPFGGGMARWKLEP